MRTIIITEDQLREIEDNFSYWDDENDTTPFDPSKITSNGYVEDGGNFPEKNTKTDDFADNLCPQYPRYRWGTRTVRAHSGLYEGVATKGVVNNNTNKEDNTADDFYEVDAVDNNELEDENLVKVPEMVKKREKQFLDAINNLKLNPKQQSVVLKDIVKNLTSSSTSYPMQKKLDKMLKNNKNINSFQIKQNISNYD